MITIVICLDIMVIYLLLGWLVFLATYHSKGEKYDGYAISFLILWPLALMTVEIAKFIKDKEVIK